MFPQSARVGAPALVDLGEGKEGQSTMGRDQQKVLVQLSARKLWLSALYFGLGLPHERPERLHLSSADGTRSTFLRLSISVLFLLTQ